jgi:hypothetical protein
MEFILVGNLILLLKTKQNMRFCLFQQNFKKLTRVTALLFP